MKKITLSILTLLFVSVGFAQVTFSTGAIPDNDPIGADFTGTSTLTGTVETITLDLDINHTWNGDLIVTLASPGGASSVIVVDRPGEPDTSSFGCSDDGMRITLDDAATGDLEVCILSGDPYPAVVGDYAPSNPLAGFIGDDANGDWTISISDNAFGDEGELVAATLNLTVLSTDENALNLFSFSPNPVRDYLNLSAASEISQVEVFNIMGQRVLAVSPNALNSDINMSALTSGVYFVKVTVDDITDSIKIVKQ